MSIWAAVTLAILVALPDDVAGGVRRLGLLPFNGKVGPDARSAVMTAMELELARKGYEVVTGDRIEPFLEEHRVRYLDSMTVAQVGDLAKELGVEGLVMGSFLAAGDEREPGAGLAVRLVEADGSLGWTATAAKGPERRSTQGPPVPAAPGELARKAALEILSGFPDPERPRPIRVQPGGRCVLPKAAGAPDLERRPQRVCLLPFTNHSPAPDAARAVEVLFARALGERPEFEVVEPAELRRAFLDEGIWSPRLLSRDQMSRLEARVGGCLFLQGDILSYEEIPDQVAGKTPRVEVHASLTKATTGRLVWSARRLRRGQQYEGLLLLGALTGQFEVGERVVQDLVKELCAN